MLVPEPHGESDPRAEVVSECPKTEPAQQPNIQRDAVDLGITKLVTAWVVSEFALIRGKRRNGRGSARAVCCWGRK